MKSWLSISPNHDFSIYNLPFGIFLRNDVPTPGIAIGDYIVDLKAAFNNDVLDATGVNDEVLNKSTLNDFIALGKKTTCAVRNRIQDQLIDTDSMLRKHKDAILVDRLTANMCLPVSVGDYTDFYSSIEHATNVGIMFRGKENALMPNWKRLPVGYHGRSSSIVVSGTDIKRPKGQMKPADAEVPVFGPTKRLDIELEMAFIIGKNTQLGDTVNIENAEEYIFGMALFNDWSARDIQGWEYVPLGPFLGKNFGSSLSPWIVTMEALEPFRTAGPKQEPAPLPYLQTTNIGNYDIRLEVSLQPNNSTDTIICRSNFKYMYWSMAQQLAHHTVNGCNIRVGDLMASGTISGPDKGSYGSLLEITWGGKDLITLADGGTRAFLEDGDTIHLRGYSEIGEKRVGFGLCSGKILPADK
jgi:fumarylacetoacetase